MPLDDRNVNTLWASVLTETLVQLGLTTAVICPGSRSAPLALAFAHQVGLEAIPVLDERSAAFFALGLSRRQGIPIALVCTSGTAGANFYPAIIEASQSQNPLLVLTADRPPQLRQCRAGQTIDQQKLYGHFPNWQVELAMPALNGELLAYLRQTLIYAWERCLWPGAGVVHLNVPFQEPLAPIPDPHTAAFLSGVSTQTFWQMVHPQLQPVPQLDLPWSTWQQAQRGLILAGPAQPAQAHRYAQAVGSIARRLGWPILADGLSPLRNFAAELPGLVVTYDWILRQPEALTTLAPDRVLQLGEFPTSKELRAWLARIQPPTAILDPRDPNFDPLHGHCAHYRIGVETLIPDPHPQSLDPRPSDYLKAWLDWDGRIRAHLEQLLTPVEDLIEAKATWILSQVLPPQTPFFVANSMSVRHLEFFWMPGNHHIQPYCNRGANGIDGTLSTALGVAHGQDPGVMLTGDLALLHDSNGFLLNPYFRGHLTIVLINNQGGGIFEMLPVAHYIRQHSPSDLAAYESFMATPQRVNIAALCAAHGVDHVIIKDWDQLRTLLNPLPLSGIRVLEIPTQRVADAQWLQKIQAGIL